MAIFGTGRRRQIMVDRAFQIRSTLIGALYILAMAACLTVPLIYMMRSTAMLLEGRSEELVQVYHSQQMYTIVSLLIFFVGLVVAWTMFSLWRTHKVAGPIVKLTRHIHMFSAGKFSDRIQLRDRDELQALARALNEMAESLEERDEKLRSEIRRVIEANRQRFYNSSSAETGVQAFEQLVRDVDGMFTVAEPRQAVPESATEAEEPAYS